jgi:hypothetical protein
MKGAEQLMPVESHVPFLRTCRSMAPSTIKLNPLAAARKNIR